MGIWREDMAGHVRSDGSAMCFLCIQETTHVGDFTTITAGARAIYRVLFPIIFNETHIRASAHGYADAP